MKMIIIGSCDFGILLYLFTQLLYFFVHKMFLLCYQENQLARYAFLWQGTTSANLEDDDVVSFLLEVVVAFVVVVVVFFFYSELA